MARYKGKDLSLTFGAEQVNLEATSVILDNEDSDDDDVTFAEIAAGTPKQWFFTVTARSDYGTGSFWTFCWDNVATEVAFVFKPYGNAVATAIQPHFTGMATVAAKPPVGGDANETFTFETRLNVTGNPVRVVA